MSHPTVATNMQPGAPDGMRSGQFVPPTPSTEAPGGMHGLTDAPSGWHGIPAGTDAPAGMGTPNGTGYAHAAWTAQDQQGEQAKARKSGTWKKAAAVTVIFFVGFGVGKIGGSDAPAQTPAPAPAAQQAPAPAPVAPPGSSPNLPNGDHGQAPDQPQITAPAATYPAGTYEITAKPGSGQYTIPVGTYETNAEYGYALITKEADGEVGSPGYRQVNVSGHTLLVLKPTDVGKYVQFGGPAEWTAKK